MAAKVWSNWFSNGDRELMESLTSTGTYTLAIEGYVFNSSPVDYGFTVQKVEDTSAALALGSQVDGAIAHAGQQNRYTFNLASAGRLYFDSLTNSGLRWSLVGPRGVEVSDRSFAGSDAGSVSGNPVLDLVAGDYTLVVDGIGDNIGAYSFRLLDLASAAAITSGTPVSGTLASGKETALYRFEAQAGERVFFDAQSQSGGSAWSRLIDPHGRQVWFSGSGDVDVQTLALTGTYTLAIEGYVVNTSPVDYGFTVQKVADTSAALALGTQVDGAIAQAGQQNRYTFSLASAGQLYFDSLTKQRLCAGAWSVPEGPRSAIAFFVRFGAVSVSANPVLIWSRAITRSSSTADRGSRRRYSFRLLDLASAAAVTRGDPVSGTLTSGIETALYRFDAPAGDQIALDRQALTAASPYWRLIDPYGGVAYAGTFSDSAELDASPRRHVHAAG